MFFSLQTTFGELEQQGYRFTPDFSFKLEDGKRWEWEPAERTTAQTDAARHEYQLRGGLKLIV